MPRIGFPFIWGAEPSSVVVLPVVPPLWSSVGGGGGTWRGVRGGLLPRFEHIYPIVTGQGWAAPVNFEYRVQTEYPLIIASENAVVVESRITNP